jgi:hypothetical protein
MSTRKYIPGEKPAQRQLRQEVAFGCPIRRCRKPFLTYHHFDPPWRVEEHFNPDGVIALCWEHHSEAEEHYTKDYLRKLKQASYSVEDVKGQFPSWQGEFLIRCAGNYVGGSKAVLQMEGEDIIKLERGEENLLFLSFHLQSKDGKTVAVMKDNVFELGPAEPYDVKTTNSKNRIKVWFAKHDIGLAVTISRLTNERLDRILKTDRERAQAKLARIEARVKEDLESGLARMARFLPDEADAIRRRYNEMTQPQSPEEIARKVAEHRQQFPTSNMPDRILQAHFSGDHTGYRVKNWAYEHCVDRDGRIRFLDFKNLSVYRNHRHVRVRNGIGGLDYNATLVCETAISL